MPNGNEGTPLPDHLIARIRRLRLERMPIRRIAALAGVSKTTVEKYSEDIAAQHRAAVEVDLERDWSGYAEEAEPDFSEVREPRDDSPGL